MCFRANFILIYNSSPHLATFFINSEHAHQLKNITFSYANAFIVQMNKNYDQKLL